MEYPYITLHTKRRSNLLFGDDLEDVTDLELETLVQKSRNTLISLEAEFEKRQLSKLSKHPGAIDGYVDILRKGVNKIDVLERLDGKALEQVEAAAQILTTPQTVRSLKVYRTFLHDVLRHCGPEVVVLCTACLGKPKVASLKEEDRISLLDHVKRNKLSYVSPILTRLAAEYGIHSVGRAQKRRHAESTSFSSRGTTDEQPKEGDCTVRSNRVGGTYCAPPWLKRY